MMGAAAFYALRPASSPCSNKALADVAYRIAMTVQGVGHLGIGPVRPVGIHLEQDMGMLDLIGRRLPGLGRWMSSCRSPSVSRTMYVLFMPIPPSLMMMFHSGIGRKSTIAKDKYY